MIQRTFPCVFLSRTYSSYAICTKKKKKNIEETLRYSPSKYQPSRRLITQRTFARKKEKPPQPPIPNPKKNCDAEPERAHCAALRVLSRVFSLSLLPLISLGLIVYLRSHPPRALENA